MEPTFSGFPQAAAISEKLMPGDTDNPVPWKEMTLSSPISFSTWKKLILSQERKTVKKRRRQVKNKAYLGWRGHYVIAQQC